MKRFIAIMFFLSILTNQTMSQEAEDFWHDIYSYLSYAEETDEDTWTEAYAILSSLSLSPKNINEASYEDLCEIPYLREEDALAVLNYLSLYGDMKTIAELQLIPSVDTPRRMILQALFYAAPSKDRLRRIFGDSLSAQIYDSLKRNKRRMPWYRKAPSRHSLTLSANIPTYRRKGYTDGTYHGFPISHTMQYAFRSSRTEGKFTASNDAGEEFFSGSNRKGWDLYSGYVKIKRLGIVKDVIVGHYQVSTGMGIIINNTWRLSRSSLLATPPRVKTTLRGHGSRQSTNYLQGIAATLAIPVNKAGAEISITPYISYQPIDATMTSRGTIQTILTTGYHRTDSEISRRSSSMQSVAGLSIAYNSPPWYFSLNYVSTAFQDSLTPKKTSLYKYYSPTGKRFSSASLSYSLRNGKWNIAGETAISQQGHRKQSERGSPTAATANSIRYAFSNLWEAFLLQRYYSYSFTAPLAKSFGDMSNSQNESGVYVGVKTTSISHLTLSGYIDAAYHPWARYRYNTPSRSFDTYILASYERGEFSGMLRYRYREQMKTYSASLLPSFVADSIGAIQHSISARMKYKGEKWQRMIQCQGSLLPGTGEKGFSVFSGVGYTEKKWSAWVSGAYFCTSSYSSRLYITDKALSYGQMSTMVYGEGFRCSIMTTAKLSDHIKLSLCSSSLFYLSRSTISSGAQEIPSSSQTDIHIQAHITL